MLPHLSTVRAGPLQDLESNFLKSSAAIEHWLREQWQEHAVPFYGSVDLRNSGFKLAPIDMNLFPGGYNNLDPAYLPLCVQATIAAVERARPGARNILLIPENHTRNLFYLQNVWQIVAILGQAGLNVRIGTLLPEITLPTQIELQNGQRLLLEPLVSASGRLGLNGFDPCVVLLNNDLSAGVPKILQGLDEQVVLPPLHAGWMTRRKSNHFSAFDDVANDFSRLVGIDSWCINPYFSVCRSIDFHGRQGEECLAANVDAVLDLTRQKYAEYGIDEKPYVVVKADAGTYGMGVMTVHDASEVIGMNRRARNKMSIVKEGLGVSEVLIQEGVHTVERVGGNVAEPVLYMIDRDIVGGFYRVHAGRNRDENLNSPGMHFEPLLIKSRAQLACFKTSTGVPDPFYAYSVVARLASLAASLELERTDPANAPNGDSTENPGERWSRGNPITGELLGAAA